MVKRLDTFFKKLLQELDNYEISAVTRQPKHTLEAEFRKEIRLRKEVNSEHIWSTYYIPIAAAEIVKEKGSLNPADKYRLECLANSLMFRDMADGKLNEFYRFEN